MEKETIYSKILKALKLGERSGVGTSLNAHESGTVLTWLMDYQEARALLKSDYQQTIDAIRADLAKAQAENERLRDIYASILAIMRREDLYETDIVPMIEDVINAKALESED